MKCSISPRYRRKAIDRLIAARRSDIRKTTPSSVQNQKVSGIPTGYARHNPA
jgi:hypothetical protein